MKHNIRRFTNMIFYFGLFSFLFFGIWEWMQSPFFTYISEDFNKIVFFTIHCTFSDILILFSIVALLCIFKREIAWIFHPRKMDYILITSMGLFYTLLSEYINVQLLQRWRYTNLMPIVPGLRIGLTPILQWLLLPSIILLVTKDHLKAIGNESQQ